LFSTTRCFHGFPELGDVHGMGIGRTVHTTVLHPAFETDPAAAARDVWERSNRYLAANGAVMRTSVLGVVGFWDVEAVRERAAAVCRVTHYDPRCVASCVVVSLLIAMMLQVHAPAGVFFYLFLYQQAHNTNTIRKNHQGELDANDPAVREEMVHVALKSAMCDLVDEDSFDFEELAAACASEPGGFAALHLDDKDSIGYTYKCLAAGLAGLRSEAGFEETIVQLAMQGGDADTNGAVCGALLGCRCVAGSPWISFFFFFFLFVSISDQA
jgi:ADP-ribosylglycohydrolase